MSAQLKIYVAVLASTVFFSFWIIDKGLGSASAFDASPFSILLYVLALLSCVGAVLSNRVGLATVTFAYFFLFPIAVVSIYQSATLRFPWALTHKQAEFDHAMILCMASILLFGFGTTLARGRIRQQPSQNRQNTLLMLSKGGIILSAIVMTVSGGWTWILSPRFNKVDVAEAGLLVQIVYTARGIALASALSLVIFRKIDRSIISPAFFWATMAYCFLIFNPISNPRFVFIGYLLSMGCAAISGWSPSRNMKSIFLLVLAVGNFFILGFIKVLGLGFADGWKDFITKFDSNFSQSLFSVDLDVPQMLANGMAYHERFGGLPFNNILGFIFFFVPRSLWMEKPVGSSYQTMGQLGYDFLNLSYPFFLDFYTSGGPVFFIVAMTFLGWAIARLRSNADSASSYGYFSSSATTYCLIVGFSPILLRGPVNSVIAFFGMAFYWVLASEVLARIRLTRT